MASLHLYLSITPSPLRFRHVQPPSLNLKPPPHAARPAANKAYSSADTEAPAKHAVLGGPPLAALYAEKDSDSLPAGRWREFMPSHVAVIMDGNRRWARMRGLPVESGYEAAVRALRVVELCCKWDIRVLTVFAFSSDNWLRPKMEAYFLMGLFERVLRDEHQHLMSADVRISLNEDSSQLLKPLKETTQDFHLIVAVNYSGQSDLVQACQKLAVKVKDGLIEPEDINEFLVERELETNCTDLPCSDLLIRTSGELRICNFLLWQLAYTELYFADSLWLDYFGDDEFLEALCSFQKRQR